MNKPVSTASSKPASVEWHDCYSLDYAGARSKFRAAAVSAGATLSTYTHPAATAPDGRPLHVDVAYLGRQSAARRMLVVSGTHGLEGFCGSAAQIAWLLSAGASVLHADVAVVLVHAINPWGFAHLSRTNENNVDINRNFIDHRFPPANAGYSRLHAALLGDQWDSKALIVAQRAMDAYAAEFGADQLYDTLAKGQYSHPLGLNFGGSERQWSNVALEQIVIDHLKGASNVGLIDWHSGIGDYGEPFFLCFNDVGSALHERAIQWWSADRIVDQQPHGRARPSYSGLLFFGVQKFLADVPLCGAVVEFGTRGWHMRRLLRLDLWLKFKADPATEQYAMLRSDLNDSFSPVDQIWRASTIKYGIEITQQAIDGISAWDDEG